LVMVSDGLMVDDPAAHHYARMIIDKPALIQAIRTQSAKRLRRV
jgi:hypothetical protein